MINPLVMEGMARQHQRDLLSRAVRSSRARRRLPKIRERLGWSLVGLGARLALEARQEVGAPAPS